MIHSGTKSTFTRYFSLILILVFTLLSLFSLYVYYMTYDNFSAQQDLSEQGILNQAIEKVDNSFYFINQIAVATANNSDVVKSGISPSLENRQRNFSIITTLKNLSEENNYLGKIYLYEHTKGYLFTSDSAITTLEGSPESATILYCLSSAPSIVLEEENNRYCSRIIQDGQKLYLVYDFVYSSKGPLNTLILELNKDNLFTNFLDTPSLGDYHVSIQGNRKSPVFSTLSQEELNPKAPVPSLSSISPYTCWTYNLYPKQAVHFSIFGSNRLFIPFFLLLLCISLILTWFITSKAYSPIKKLTQLVDTDTPKEQTRDSSNEFIYLEHVYQKLISDNQIASDLMEEARPELEQRLFSNILNGNEYTCQELDQQLSTLHSVFRVNEKYQVILLQLKDNNTDVWARHIHRKQLCQLASQTFLPAWGHLQLLTANDQQCILIIQYPHEFSMAQIKRIVRSFQNSLEKQGNSSSLQVTLAAGKVYYSLPEILHSFRDASEQLRYHLYYCEDTRLGASQDAHSISREYFSSLAHQIDISLGKGNIALADALLSQMLEELFASNLAFTDTKELCEQLLDIFVEKSLAYHVTEPGSDSRQYPLLYQRLRAATQKEDLSNLMREETGKLLELLHTESQKRQHQLIIRAKEYISVHYNNCDLSINEIAQDVGCTPSYLSNIFTEYTHENLVAYLNSFRINMAKDLLVNSQILIKDIGFKTGFNTIQNFNRVFKKNTNMTPKEYRKAYQKL
ncbi:MAG: helix-turn-helix transcriptional regulator [Lachnospiraceae bacterium]|nr:helix-turn-helix transcriptional regulator [Lachnospiraceae bacterium]